MNKRIETGSTFPTFYLLGVLFCLCISPSLKVSAQANGYDETVREYITKFRAISVREMMEYRIPASITLAQGIFESNAGKSLLAREANNHFGIKCHKDWTGGTYIQDDETKNECFRKYVNPEESFRDHSYFLSRQDRYRNLFNLDINDYKGWANGLKECGYATNPDYARHLIQTIEDWGLFRLDVADFSLAFADSLFFSKDSVRSYSPSSSFNAFAEGPGKRMVYVNNGLQFIIMQKNDNIDNIAKAFHISTRKIRRFNDLKDDAALITGQMVYLEPKKKKGAATRHTVKSGETMYTISQSYGVQLTQLYKRNKMKPGHHLKSGQTLLLR